MIRLVSIEELVWSNGPEIAACGREKNKIADESSLTRSTQLNTTTKQTPSQNRTKLVCGQVNKRPIFFDE